MADIFELFRKIGRGNAVVGKPEFIVVGLGNPGSEYEGTRHNAGFSAIDYIAGNAGIRIRDLKFKSLMGRGEIAGRPVMLLKPQTFMNLSGTAVKEACDFYDVPPERLIVISDDVNLDPGRIRIRRSGSDGGHKGLYNIIYSLSSDNFPRVRLGVGRKPDEWDMVDWVLGKMGREDAEKLVSTFESVNESVRLIIEGRTDDAMGKFNGVTPNGEGTDRHGS
ncbi:MAG: aminoacyl-tRNA hydrolase [Clostridia bacterium]|nr:aminoacyl-tRNA hydrolase [Clostridia bacterium]